MCRSIQTLFNYQPPASDEEIRAASLQFVRKLSGFSRPSRANEAVFERSVEEVFQNAKEAFVTGTAAGITHFDSLTHEGRTVNFGSGKMGDVTHGLLKTLKGIQFGAVPDTHEWMFTATA